MWIDARPQRGPTFARLSGIPEGKAGAIATMQQMAVLVRQAVRDNNQHIREFALPLAVAAGDFPSQARALQEWVKSNISYIRDPPDVELVQTPQYTLQHRAGDCDDQAVLLASMLMATGHPARFVAVGFRNQPLSHVMVQTKIGSQWLGAETIIDRPFGWMPPGVTSSYVVEV